MSWILNNKEWIFSGIGISIFTLLARYLMNFNKKKNSLKNIKPIKVSIGKGNNFSGNFAGRDIIIYQSDIQNKMTELIEIFEQRAIRIKNYLEKHFHYIEIQNYLNLFDKLHKSHINALRNDNFVLANEILYEIHRLSFDLERDEFWTKHKKETPDLLYQLRKDAFQKGILISIYLIDNEEPYSEEMNLYDRNLKINNKSKLKENEILNLYISIIKKYEAKQSV